MTFVELRYDKLFNLSLIALHQALFIYLFSNAFFTLAIANDIRLFLLNNRRDKNR